MLFANLSSVLDVFRFPLWFRHLLIVQPMIFAVSGVLRQGLCGWCFTVVAEGNTLFGICK